MNKKTMAIAVLVGITGLYSTGISSAFAATYTTTQVAAHNSATDCWEIINGNVYNLTAFITQHSGGQAVIIGQCGKDATATFNSGPHSATTITALNPYLLGTIAAPVVTPPVVTPPVVTPPTTPPVVPTHGKNKSRHESGEQGREGGETHRTARHTDSSSTVPTGASAEHAESEGSDE